MGKAHGGKRHRDGHCGHLHPEQALVSGLPEPSGPSPASAKRRGPLSLRGLGLSVGAEPQAAHVAALDDGEVSHSRPRYAPFPLTVLRSGTPVTSLNDVVLGSAAGGAQWTVLSTLPSEVLYVDFPSSALGFATVRPGNPPGNLARPPDAERIAQRRRADRERRQDGLEPGGES